LEAVEPAAAPARRRGLRFLRRGVRLELGLGTAVVAGTTIVPLAIGSIYWGQVFLLADVYLIGAIFLNILRGEAGQISFGQGAIFGASAYATAMSAGVYGVPIVPAMLIGVGAALVFGVLMALPALRVQGYYLAFVTLAAAVVFPELLRAYNDFTRAITGISVFVPHVGETIFWGMDWVAITILCCTIAALAVHAVIRSSRFGRQMRVAAASPEAALSLGISPPWLRIAAFAIAAVGTGVAGALYVPLFGFVSLGAFPLSLSILLYFAVVVGGDSTLLGPIAGIYLLYVLPNNVLSSLVEYRLLIYGAIALGVMLFFPDGLVGSIKTFLQRKLRPTVAPLVSIATLVRGRTTGRDGNGADAAPAPAAPSVLHAEGASKSFGAVRALDDMSLDVVAGEIHGLVGPNGSGKTTLLNALSAFIRLDSGRVTVDGASKRSARARARQGVGRTFQTPRVFEGLTMWENIDVTHHSPGADSALDPTALAEVRDLWDAVDAAALPHAQRRLLEIVRVLKTDPRILLLDEPAAGLSAEERLAFADVLRILAHQLGIAVVLVEHDLTLVWQIADRITVMDEGRLLCSGTPEELNENPALEAVLLTGGRRVEAD